MNQTEQMREALQRAFNLGQRYWQQADSDYQSEHKKADETYQKYKQLVDDTLPVLNHVPGTGKMAGPAIGRDSIKEDLAASLMAANSLIGCLIEGKQITTGMVSITRHRIEQSLRYYQDQLSGPAEPKHGGTS